MWKHWPSVKFRLAVYAFIGYDFFELIFINNISIQIKHPSRGVLHFYTDQYDTDWRWFMVPKDYIILSQNWQTLFLSTKSMCWKQKRLLQSVLMIAHFYHCFWSKTLKSKLEAQNTSGEQLPCKTLSRTCPFIKSFSMTASGHSLWSLRFSSCSFLIL